MRMCCRRSFCEYQVRGSESRIWQQGLPGGFQVDGQRLRTPDGRFVLLQTLPADRDFPNVFRMACRRRPLKSQQNRGLDGYAMNAAVVGPAGSLVAAQFMLEASASLIRAGGVGVFIDNSVLAHSGPDWLELAENRHDPAAVFYAFVSVAKLHREILSHGMHVFGQRDAIVSRDDDLQSLEDFLRMSCSNQPELGDGETFCGSAGEAIQPACGVRSNRFSPTIRSTTRTVDGGCNRPEFPPGSPSSWNDPVLEFLPWNSGERERTNREVSTFGLRPAALGRIHSGV